MYIFCTQPRHSSGCRHYIILFSIVCTLSNKLSLFLVNIVKVWCPRVQIALQMSWLFHCRSHSFIEITVQDVTTSWNTVEETIYAKHAQAFSIHQELVSCYFTYAVSFSCPFEPFHNFPFIPHSGIWKEKQNTFSHFNSLSVSLQIIAKYQFIKI